MAKTLEIIVANPPTKIDTEQIKVPCEVYSRIVGYLRPVQNWNAGKQQEFSERQVFEYAGVITDES